MGKKNKLKIRDISVKMLFSVFIFTTSCQTNVLPSKENLIGKWKSIDKNKPLIILDIKEDAVYRYENGYKFIYPNFSVSGDTLIMINSKFNEKHIIIKLTKNKLQLGAINPYQEDIQLIDEAEFEKE